MHFSRMAPMVVGALLVGACSVGSDGVVRSAPLDDGEETVDESAKLSDGDCPELLETLQTAAVDLVGPNGFIGAGPTGQDPFFGGAFGRGVFFEGFGFGFGQPGASAAGESAVIVGDYLAVERGGRLYLIDQSGAALGSVWLDALPPQMGFPSSTGLLGRADDLVVISSSVRLTDESDDEYAATVVQRIDLTDPSNPRIAERLTIRGDIAGSDVADGRARIAISVPAPALDFLSATTEGGEIAATEHNRTLLAETSIGDWLGSYELTTPSADESESPQGGLLGGCDVIAAPGAESALGSTVLLEFGDTGSLVGVQAQTILGQGRVTYDGDRVFVLSARSHALGFAAPGQQGSPRVVVTMLADDEGAYRVEATGILAGSLAPLDAQPVGDGGLLIFTSDFDQFGEGGISATGFVADGDELDSVGAHDVPVDTWGPLRVELLGNRILISGGERSALIDATDLAELDITGLQAQWDRGDFRGAPVISGFGDNTLTVDPGPVVQNFGGLHNFLDGFGRGDFGFGWEPWFEQQGPVAIRVVEGDPFDGDEIASFETTAFALWPVSTDPSAGRIVAGVLALVDDDAPGGLFSGVLVLTLEDGELVETARSNFDTTQPENFGANECTRTNIDGLSDMLGLWNQTVLRCEEGEPGGMVGHSCFALALPDLSADEMQAWFGGPNAEIEASLAELQEVMSEGATLQGCTPRQAGGLTAPESFHPDDGGGWIVSTVGVHRVDAAGRITTSAPLEPPYEL